MLRIHFTQQWFNLSDPAMEDATPDESTILRIRHLLERRELGERIFALMRALLEQRRLLLKSGTIVDGTTIDVPPSTKSEAKTRDPQVGQGKKNAREWRRRMKAHVGTDRTGLVHTLMTTPAGTADITQLPQLLRGTARELYGGRAY